MLICNNIPNGKLNYNKQNRIINYTNFTGKALNSFCKDNVILLCNNECPSPINNEEIFKDITNLEYRQLIAKLKYYFKRDRNINGTISDTRSETDKNNILMGGGEDPYATAPLNLMGMIPYCGFSDISYDINNFLKYSKNGYLATLPKGQPINHCKLLVDTNSETVTEFIKCLNYSLKQLDEKYGKYDGLVYRGGLFKGNGKQYYSCSKEIKPLTHVDSQNGHDLQFHIIRTHNGHKIYKFQKDYYKPGGINNVDYEQEVLLSDNKFIDITNKELYINEKINFAKVMFNYLNKDSQKYYLEDILKRIQVWEET